MTEETEAKVEFLWGWSHTGAILPKGSKTAL